MEKENVSEELNDVQLSDGEEKLATAQISKIGIFIAIISFTLAFLSLIIMFIVADSMCNRFHGSGVFDWIAEYFFEGYIFAVIFFLIFIILGIICLSTNMICSKLIITNKRIIGTVGVAKKRVDLPISAISSIGTSEALNSLCFATSSGKIRFTFVKNRQEIYEIVSQLLNEKNQKQVLQPSAKLNLTDLAELKNLLDAGVITKEEFDEKKKQILDI